ncbi:unnamed protein product [Parnassius apollo]|uniref:(apollo) hypothetical protein n=1 Tax=Parnassius apollo TaxID=110799 RepID=A0A8S3Y149_PARAO|nr:unnamed protein product [Parnassius apollo]
MPHAAAAVRRALLQHRAAALARLSAVHRAPRAARCCSRTPRPTSAPSRRTRPTECSAPCPVCRTLLQPYAAPYFSTEPAALARLSAVHRAPCAARCCSRTPRPTSAPSRRTRPTECSAPCPACRTLLQPHAAPYFSTEPRHSPD